MFRRDYHINNFESNVENNEISLRAHDQHQTFLQQLVYLQNMSQFAAEADIKAVQHMFSGGTLSPYNFKSISQLQKFLNGDENSASSKAFDSWNSKTADEQEEVKKKLKDFLGTYEDFIYYTRHLKTTAAQTIIGDEESVEAIDYLQRVNTEISDK